MTECPRIRAMKKELNVLLKKHIKLNSIINQKSPCEEYFEILREIKEKGALKVGQKRINRGAFIEKNMAKLMDKYTKKQNSAWGQMPTLEHEINILKNSISIQTIGGYR